jgi:hypothetical protein
MEDQLMKKIPMRSFVAAMILGVCAIGLTGCEDKEAKKEIERLTAEAEYLEKDLDSERKRVTESREKLQLLRQEMNKLAREKRNAESRLKNAERQVAQFKKREEATKVAKKNEPSRRDKIAAAKKVAEERLGALVTIKGTGTKGHGFLVEADEKTWIYFSPSVLSGSAKLDIEQSGGGNLSKFGAFELAGGTDLARLEVLDEVEAKLKIGDSSALESGATLFGVGEAEILIEGRFSGVEGLALKGDSRMTRGVPGTPVLAGEGADLVGMTVAGEGSERKLWADTKLSSRAGRATISRLDRNIEWTASPIGSFLEEAKVIEDADRLTRLVSAFAMVRPDAEGLDLSSSVGGGQSAKELLEENENVSAVRALHELDEWLKEKGGRMSDSSRARKVKGVFEEMLSLSERHTSKFSARKFSAYYGELAKESIQWRNDAEASLAKFIEEQE